MGAFAIYKKIYFKEALRVKKFHLLKVRRSTFQKVVSSRGGGRTPAQAHIAQKEWRIQRFTDPLAGVASGRRGAQKQGTVRARVIPPSRAPPAASLTRPPRATAVAVNPSVPSAVSLILPRPFAVSAASERPRSPRSTLGRGWALGQSEWTSSCAFYMVGYYSSSRLRRR